MTFYTATHSKASTNNINNIPKIVRTSALLSALFFAHSASAADINFEISSVADAQGKLYVQLFKGEQSYRENQAVNATMMQASQGTMVITFANVSAGEYALRFFHDQNNNGNLDTNLFGLPAEGYGFSNNAKPNFGPVSYQDIKFSVTEDQALLVNKTEVIY